MKNLNFLARVPVLLLCFMVPTGSSAFDIPNENRIYDGNIKTVQFYKEGFEMSAPVIQLHSSEQLVLAFDELGQEELKVFRYTIIHCESDWATTESLLVTDYIEGLQEGRIEDYAYSANTTVPYIHYRLVFPGSDVAPKISGNYILKVYLDDPGNVVLTRRFWVMEPTSFGVVGNVHQATNPGDRDSKQEVDFTIMLNGIRLMNPVEDVKVLITQNDRTDNEIRNLKPRFVRTESLDYSYDEENTFNGGNEFRTVDFKSLVYQTERIKTIQYDRTGYHVYLLDDLPRPAKNYISEKDINGRMYIKNEDHATNSDIEADYAWVYFRLPVKTIFVGGQVYILGELTDWQISDSSRMDYDAEGKCYTKRLFLKQGLYNYIYVVRDNKTGKTDESPIEGSHWETENEYTIWVYFRPAGAQTDRLVAVQNLSSYH